MADVTEEEAAAVLGALGVTVERQRKVQEVLKTPLPSPGDTPGIQSEVEWI
ncbi:hypothetical protein [Streptomyces sp. NPDC006012]|uniref:hypothetical protein n=1 Tax=Streptomyces sp. NPDC006012 TaxID=3364739 RepID=UPI00367790A0